MKSIIDAMKAKNADKKLIISDVIESYKETYTLDEVKELIRQAYVDGYENGYVKGDWFGKIEEFYKKHL